MDDSSKAKNTLRDTLITHRDILVAFLPTILDERLMLTILTLDAIRVTREALDKLVESGSGAMTPSGRRQQREDWLEYVTTATETLLKNYENSLTKTPKLRRGERSQQLRDSLAALYAL